MTRREDRMRALRGRLARSAALAVGLSVLTALTPARAQNVLAAPETKLVINLDADTSEAYYELQGWLCGGAARDFEKWLDTFVAQANALTKAFNSGTKTPEEVAKENAGFIGKIHKILNDETGLEILRESHTVLIDPSAGNKLTGKIVVPSPGGSRTDTWEGCYSAADVSTVLSNVLDWMEAVDAVFAAR